MTTGAGARIGHDSGLQYTSVAASCKSAQLTRAAWRAFRRQCNGDPEKKRGFSSSKQEMRRGPVAAPEPSTECSGEGARRSLGRPSAIPLCGEGGRWPPSWTGMEGPSKKSTARPAASDPILAFGACCQKPSVHCQTAFRGPSRQRPFSIQSCRQLFVTQPRGVSRGQYYLYFADASLQKAQRPPARQY